MNTYYIKKGEIIIKLIKIQQLDKSGKYFDALLNEEIEKTSVKATVVKKDNQNSHKDAYLYCLSMTNIKFKTV